MGDFTHFDEQGNAVMVDVHAKDDTYRVAVATGKIKVSQEVYEAITNHTAKKGRCPWCGADCRNYGGKKECRTDSALSYYSVDQLRDHI